MCGTPETAVLHALEQLNAGDPRHLQVKQHEQRRLELDGGKRLVGVAGRVHAQAATGQKTVQRVAHIGLVVDNERQRPDVVVFRQLGPAPFDIAQCDDGIIEGEADAVAFGATFKSAYAATLCLDFATGAADSYFARHSQLDRLVEDGGHATATDIDQAAEVSLGYRCLRLSRLPRSPTDGEAERADLKLATRRCSAIGATFVHVFINLCTVPNRISR